MTTILETGHVAPPPGATETITVPFSMFDMMWLHFPHPIRRLIFYDHRCSTAEFTAAVLPRLKESLSLALKHYLPIAGKLMYPKNKENKPIFRYVPGDSVPFTAAESAINFDELIGNHARDADQFYDFAPPFPAAEEEDEHKKSPLFAVKVTLFPMRGISIGISNHHCVGDASSIFRFVTSWASICNKEDDQLRLHLLPPPVFDRSVINDNKGIDLIYWKIMREIPFKTAPFPLPTNRVRATFTLSPADIKKLKETAVAKKPHLTYTSSFVVTACYTWVCFLKSGAAVGEEVSGDTKELLGFPVDVRGRVDPPIPEAYFGNCLGFGAGLVENRILIGEDGFAVAVEVIGEDLKKRVNEKGEVLKGAENWMSEWEKFEGARPFGISGSPKFDISGADFGWGRGRKLEVLSIDGEEYAMSLCKSENGDLEIGLSLSEERMAAFAAIFSGGLTP